ncbi:hypothetical protein [Flavobacterium reichenbachii]|uniref:Uncharacterized protein n=1 Tax=Flavobacterium reichenbachii TaxID=362418 RepID=A0A085ZKD1_9FLAO|nr:hypothetical protein [Flavobacterium reichenbachii]KFF04895.1 hypothetical protein IW19_04845 [Flavobacterium reichenbachii]OXB12120.1 hypothetical protein B0A68_19340 [Flavobacterium reichenbachii]
MKKKLEADLISIAHRILKLKNKSDINQLYLETQKLYEKLAILKFVEENFDAVKPTIGQSDITSELETIFDKEETLPAATSIETPAAVGTIELAASYEPEVTEEKAAEVNEPLTEKAAQPIAAEVIEPIAEKTEEPIAAEIIEPVIEKTEEPIVSEIIELEAEKESEKIEEPKNDIEELSFTTKSILNPIPDFKPAFELTEEPKEEIKETIETKPNPAQILFEDLGINYADAQFVKVDSFEAVSPAPSTPDFKETKTAPNVVIEKTESRPSTLNEKLAKGFHIDLNDRIAFTKNLFGNSTEDYSRVLNQLLTFDSYSEAVDFIENMVKPDYNNWEGKDDYAERFLGIVEKKFS